MNYTYKDTAILVFCKAPIAGQVKTRLIPDFSADEAALIHLRLSENLFSKLHHASLCPVQLYCSPRMEFNFFRQCARKYNFTLHLQQGNDLGQRMHMAFCQALENYRHVLIIGCDCPVLNEDYLKQAIKKLKRHHNMVIGPALDGGYVLIGLKQPQPELFQNIAWGSNSVLEDTLNYAAKLSLETFLLPVLWDIDQAEDIFKLQQLDPELWAKLLTKDKHI